MIARTVVKGGYPLAKDGDRCAGLARAVRYFAADVGSDFAGLDFEISAVVCRPVAAGGGGLWEISGLIEVVNDRPAGRNI
jgi:hypothetical protein